MELCKSCRSEPADQAVVSQHHSHNELHNIAHTWSTCTENMPNDILLKELAKLVRNEIRSELEQFGDTWLRSSRNSQNTASKDDPILECTDDLKTQIRSQSNAGQKSVFAIPAQPESQDFPELIMPERVQERDESMTHPGSHRMDSDDSMVDIANLKLDARPVSGCHSNNDEECQVATSHGEASGPIAAPTSHAKPSIKHVSTISILAETPRWVDQSSRRRGNESFASRLVSHKWFDYCTGIVILLNAAFIGFQADWAATHIGENSPGYFKVVEIMFCVVFTLELALKMYVDRMEFIFTPDWAWNLFDVVVVGLGLMDQIVSLISSEGGLGANLSVIRVLRVIRLIRIVRVVRVLRFFRELRMMLYSVMHCCKSLVWAVLLVVVMIYVIGIFILQLVTGYIQGLSPDDEHDIETLELYWSDLGKSMLSLWMSVSGGVDWGDVVEPLVEHIAPSFGLFFSLYIAFAVLALLNVVTGLFVEKALASALDDRDAVIQEQLAREESYANEMRRCFHEADLDGSGTISWKEFRNHLGDHRVQAYFKTLDIDASEILGLFKLLDINSTGEVGTDDFVAGCMRLKGQARGVDLATLMYENKRLATSLNRFIDFVKDGFMQLGVVPEMKQHLGNQDVQDPYKVTGSIKQFDELGNQHVEDPYKVRGSIQQFD